MLTYSVAYATIYVVDIATLEAASQLGVSQRQVQRLARGGHIVSQEFAGRTVVARSSVLAASRTKHRGRRWDAQTVAAAAELLDLGFTERVTGSQLSRLRARLRTITVAELAYHSLGDRVTLWRKTGRASALRVIAEEGFTTIGEVLTTKVTRDASALARSERLLKDLSGDVLLIELDTEAPSVVEDIALFAYGDTRTSSAAQARIEGRQRALA